ncbi:MAG: hypothetical protein ACOYXB_13250 [Bacteroidota bacterium]
MKKTSFLSAFILFILLPLTAQDKFNVNTQEIQGNGQSSVVRLSLLAPSVEADVSLDEKTSLSIEVWSGFLLAWGSAGTSFHMFYGLQLEPRFFANQAKRQALGKRTDHYSGAYVGLPLSLELSSPYITFGPVGGFQNMIGQHGFWRIEFGPGLMLMEDRLYMTRIGSLALGFILE